MTTDRRALETRTGTYVRAMRERVCVCDADGGTRARETGCDRVVTLLQWPRRLRSVGSALWSPANQPVATGGGDRGGGWLPTVRRTTVYRTVTCSPAGDRATCVCARARAARVVVRFSLPPGASGVTRRRRTGIRPAAAVVVCPEPPARRSVIGDSHDTRPSLTHDRSAVCRRRVKV